MLAEENGESVTLVVIPVQFRDATTRPTYTKPGSYG